MLDLLSLTEPRYARGYLTGPTAALAARPIPSHGPKVSIVVPVWQPPRGYLCRAVQSVLAQTYQNWQLVLADDASPDATVGPLLQALAAQDARICTVRAERHGHIALASNLGIAHADGAYVTFLDQDDELSPHALAEVVRTLADHPNAGLVYTDEDHVDPFGTRFMPYFKPGWSPDLLRSQNYICHLAVYPRALVTALGGFKAGTEGAQDHDLVLRATAKLAPANVVHLPEVLYHWRTLETSTATHGFDAKPYALEAGRRAAADAAQACLRDAEATVDRGFYRVRWPLTQTPTRVRLLLHGPGANETAVAAWRAATLPLPPHLSAEWTAVPTPAADGGVAALALNAAATAAPSDVLVLARHDARPASGAWLADLLRHATRDGVGCVTGKRVDAAGAIASLGLVIDADGELAHSHAGCPAHIGGYFGRTSVVHNVVAVDRNLLAVRTSLWQAGGGLGDDADPRLADAKFGLRLHAQDQVHVVEPNVVVQAPIDGTPPLPSRFAAPAPHDPYFNPHLAVRPNAPAYRVPDAPA